MQKVMLFIDFENFDIALSDYYAKTAKPMARLDYNALPQKIVGLLPGTDNRLIKTFLFAPKPDDFLLHDARRKSTYDWIKGLNSKKYFTVIEGRHAARPVTGYTYSTMDINNPSSYYVQEKGTDVNMAAHMIAKGFLQAYDTAVVLSGDTDYIPILEILNTIGKTTVCVGIRGQNMTLLRCASDDMLILDDNFFSACLRP
jgi:uncharacterized LabA/DUF88 family protein